MSIPADKIIPLLGTQSGLPGYSNAEFTALLQALVGSPTMVFYRGTYVATTGNPAAAEDCTFTTTLNQSGFSLESSNTRLLFPSTGYYAVWADSPSVISVTTPVAGLVASGVPYYNFLLSQFGVGAVGSYLCPASYVATTGGAVTDVHSLGGSLSAVMNVTNIATQYLRVIFTNNYFAATASTLAGRLIVMKLRS